MRGRIVVIGLVLVASVAAALAWQRGANAPAILPPGRASLVGDSLNVGVEQYLRDELSGWQIDADDEVGRSTAVGLERLHAAGTRLAPYVVVSLGTNDPSRTVDAFRADVAEALRVAGVRRCVVWVAISRDGDAYEAFNAVLRGAAGAARNLRVVDWPALLRGHPEYLASDGVHATPDGYRARAHAIADALRGCPAQPVAASQ